MIFQEFIYEFFSAKALRQSIEAFARHIKAIKSQKKAIKKISETIFRRTLALLPK